MEKRSTTLDIFVPQWMKERFAISKDCTIPNINPPPLELQDITADGSSVIKLFDDGINWLSPIIWSLLIARIVSGSSILSQWVPLRK